MPDDFSVAVAGCVASLCEVFGKTPSDGTFRAYEIGLHGLEPEQIRIATTLALQNCRFMPPPSELRDLIFHSGQDRAVKAWLAFEQAVTQCSFYVSVDFDDPIINATIRSLGGWQACCETPASEFDNFLRKRFIDSYCSLLRTGISDDQAAPLLGWFDQQNSLNGYGQKEAVRIETGLPTSPTRIGHKLSRADIPRLELQRP